MAVCDENLESVMPRQFEQRIQHIKRVVRLRHPDETLHEVDLNWRDFNGLVAAHGIKTDGQSVMLYDVTIESTRHVTCGEINISLMRSGQIRSVTAKL